MDRSKKTVPSYVPSIVLCISSLLLCLGACESEDEQLGTGSVCNPNTTVGCTCDNNQTGSMTCLPDGTTYSQCSCTESQSELIQSNLDASVTPTPAPTRIDASRPQTTAGSSGNTAPTIDASVTPPLDAGSDGTTSQNPPQPTSGTSGSSGSGGTAGSAGSAGSGSTNPNDELDAVRQACVDHINMYRATLGLPALKRAAAQQEACTDEGSKSDSEIYYSSGIPHTSGGQCLGGPQNTCPMLRVGGWGPATLKDAVIACLDSMWNEGEPPIGREACERDSSGCFMEYGHYLNMSRETSTTVSCGFYEMEPGQWWSNQDFDMQWSW